MKHGRAGSGADLSSSDEEGSGGHAAAERIAGERPAAERARASRPGALLERCAVPAPAAPRDSGKAEGEGVFEIRDFTTASSFERIAHQITLAAKKWAGLLKTSPIEEGQLMREEFAHMDFRYELLFQLLPQDAVAAALPAPKGSPPDRLGLHSFPTRAHRLQRWFGVHHFAIVSVRGQEIDLDSARTVLSALVLAVQSVSPSLAQPLSCFVPVDGGRRRRYLGELLSGGRRTLYSTDLATSVQPNLEHLEGLLEFFQLKLGAIPEDQSQSLMIGVRFTYLCDAFDRLAWAESGPPQLQAPAAAGAAAAGEGPTAAAPAPASVAAVAAEQLPTEGAALDRDETDPVDSVQLHCLWPSFPQGSFVDTAVFSELDPRSAPYWKIRVLRTDSGPLPLSRLLRTLLDFRKEARAVRSAEHSVQPQLPKTALASLSHAIQESLESILLPTPGEMQEFAEACLSCPVAAPALEHVGAELRRMGGMRLARLRGGLRGTCLAKFAELASRMRCFKGSVVLWCQVLLHMRQQWEAGAPSLGGQRSEPSPRTHRCGARGVRSEFFDASCCLVQQKFEMLQRSVETRRSGLPLAPAAPTPAEMRIQATGAAMVSPQLLRPALMTEDMVVQQDMAAASIPDPAERAELHIREVQSDAAAFKAANPQAELADFLAWRTQVEGLSLQPFPEAWLDRIWRDTPARPAAEQSTALFEPEREAEMALHYLENIDGTQLLLQIFRVQLRATLEELSCGLGDVGARGGSTYLRVLRDRAAAAALSAFCGGGPAAPEEAEVDAEAVVTVGEVAEFPPEVPLQSAMAAVEALEAAVRLASSLRAKLPAEGEALLEELLAEGEAAVTSHAQRRVVEALFERGRALAQAQLREPLDGHGVFESLPLAKEFVLLLQPAEVGGTASPASVGCAVVRGAGGCGARRLYAEVRERHLRLAIARSSRVA